MYHHYKLNEELVQRVPYPVDNRVIQVFISKKGEQVLKKLRSLAAKVFKSAFEGISDEEIIVFTETLKKVRRNLSK